MERRLKELKMPKKPEVVEIRVDSRRCKGCEICVHFCPKNVLALVDGKATVINFEDCIACDLCELRCPDFAIRLIRDGGGDDA